MEKASSEMNLALWKDVSHAKERTLFFKREMNDAVFLKKSNNVLNSNM
jgi:hypothetical protein